MSQKLVKLAKDNGSTDNITVIVVFLKSIGDLINTDSMEDISTKDNNVSTDLYDGVTSTSVFIGKDVDNMSNGNDSRKSSGASSSDSNPFLTSGDLAGLGIDESPSKNPFANAEGGGFYGEVVNPFAEGDGGLTNQNGEDAVDFSGLANSSGEEGGFKRASPSLFGEADDSGSAIGVAKRGSDGIPDFMSSTEASWIPTGTPSGAAAGTNPFLLKGDSGFISPVSKSSNNQSASSEDSAENVEERSAVTGTGSDDPVAGGPVLPVAEVDSDEEAKEAEEVTKLLSSGVMETQFGELMMSASRETPTPPAEETGK